MDGYWCKFINANKPEIRYDPLQSYRVGDEIYGLRISIVSTRADRPRETRRSTNLSKETYDPEKSILVQIARGDELSIPVAADEQTLDTPYANPGHHQLMSYEGVCIVNKYAALDANGLLSPGIALVSFANQYSEHINAPEPIYHMLIALRTCIQSLVPSTNKVGVEFNTSIIFLNIGPSSGASLRQLHAQAYVVDKLHGSISESFQRAYLCVINKSCLICDLAHNDTVIDHLEQRINISELILWEDENVRLIHPFAPIRPFSLRLFVKRHVATFVHLSNSEIQSISLAFTQAYQMLKEVAPKGWRSSLDRSIAVRQAQRFDSDYHLFIDLMSTIPLGAAEVVDSLSITSFHPTTTASRMRESIKS